MRKFKDRYKVIVVSFIGIALIFAIKIFYIQVINQEYKFSAKNNVLRYEILQPTRGLIYDRDSIIIVSNEPAYDLMIIPREVKKMDTLKLSNLLKIPIQEFREKMSRAIEYSRFRESVFLKQINQVSAGNLQEKLYEYPGFFLRTISMRKYAFSSGAHVLGYMGEVNEKKTQKDKYYTKGDFAGVTGIEAAYEKYLRGKKGITIKLVDVHNQVQGKFNNGKYDTLSVSGKNLIATINIELQEYAEKLMKDKIGAIVALEPETGEILALISAPTYSPNDLIGRGRSSKFKELITNNKKPLFNRSLLGEYPPGSTFKLINSLIMIQEGLLESDKKYSCFGDYDYGGKKNVGCHSHKSPLFLQEGIAISCNSYFCHAFEDYFRSFGSARTAYDSWSENVKSFGIGDWMGNDFISGRKGLLPTAKYYDKKYGYGRWNSGTIISMAIGQGELLLTPIQMANMTAIIANRGFYITPHIIKSIEGEAKIDSVFTTKKYCSINPEAFEDIVEAMEMVIKNKKGTANNVFIKDLKFCGKTGTAENSKGKDHSIFIGFAPKENPKIALAVYVENQGWGSAWAAPIGALIVEKYLRGGVSNLHLQNHILNNSFEIKK